MKRDWIFLGGSPCSGKSSVARRLAEQYGLRLYHCDDAYPRHVDQATAESAPTLFSLRHVKWNELWSREPERLLGDEIRAYGEEFPMIMSDVADIEKEADNRPLMLEGAAFMPDLLAALPVSRERACFLIPTPAFQRATYRVRGAWVDGILGQCDDPEAAFDNWMARDALFSRHVAERAAAHGYRVIVVSGEQTIAEHAEEVAQHFELD